MWMTRRRRCIPELALADPNWFGIVAASTTGQVVEIGESNQTFTIQSISKPFVYGIALEHWGRDAVLEKVAVEPSGDPFNSIVLDERSNRPFNPMVNAGAIATADLIQARINGAQQAIVRHDEAFCRARRAHRHQRLHVRALDRTPQSGDRSLDAELRHDQAPRG
jgi:glutaminase